MFPSKSAILSGGIPANLHYLEFDGSDDYVQVAHDTTINIGSNLTVSAWIKTNASAQQTIISKGDSDSEDSWYVELSSGGIVRAGVQNSSNYRLEDGTGDLRGTTWHNVVAVINKDASLVYVDGALQDGTNVTGSTETSTMANTSPLYIGQRDHSGNGRYWTGSIDEVAVWNTNLDADAITQVYNSGNYFDLRSNNGNYDAYRGNLAAYWIFGEGSGTIAVDSAANNNNGTLVNAVTWKLH